MSYATKKGYDGEIKMAEEINQAIREFGYEAQRVGNPESYKHWLFGDVCIMKDKDKNCVLSDYFLESKKQGNPSIWKTGIKAEEDAKQYNKKGAIIRLERQKKGERLGRGGNNDVYYCMKPKTFIRIINELQSNREFFSEYEQKLSEILDNEL